MSRTKPRSIEFVVDGRIAHGDTPILCDALRALLVGSDVELVICDVGGLVHPDAVAVDALARLQLTTQRFGCRMRLLRPSPELLELIVFMGLSPTTGS